MGEPTQPSGWIRDSFDPRDYTFSHQSLSQILLQGQASRQISQVADQIISGLMSLIDGISTIEIPSSVFEVPNIPDVKFSWTSGLAVSSRSEKVTTQPFKVTVLNPEVKQEIQQKLDGIHQLAASGGEATRKILTMVPATLVALQAPASSDRPPSSGGETVIQLEPARSACQPAANRAPLDSESHRLYIPLHGTLAELEQYTQDHNRQWHLPKKFLDLKANCHHIQDQNQHDYQACSAHVGVALIENFIARCHPELSTPSPALRFSSRFLYRVTRVLNNQGDLDSGATLRDTLKAMMLFGLPPEDYWAWKPTSETSHSTPDENLCQDPPAFCYAYAQNYRTLRYLRLDRVGMAPEVLLAQIKAALLGGFPIAFGFRVFSDNLYAASQATGKIPAPPSPIPPLSTTPTIAGHAALAIGYDDDCEIPGCDPGALYFQNSWGQDWGEQGFGWLPYDYILKATEENGLSQDWWTLLGTQWTETSDFGILPGEKGVLTLGERSRPGD